MRNFRICRNKFKGIHFVTGSAAILYKYLDFDKSERKKFIVVSEIRYRPQDYGLVKERPIQTCHFLLLKSASKRPDRKKNCIIYRHYN